VKIQTKRLTDEAGRSELLSTRSLFAVAMNILGAQIGQIDIDQRYFCKHGVNLMATQYGYYDFQR
jgi:hypothetical protein